MGLLHSDNEDPLVRGLALRSLCSLRMESVLEYVQQPLEKSLMDISAYVRKTGVMGMLKVQTAYYPPQLYNVLPYLSDFCLCLYLRPILSASVVHNCDLTKVDTL